MLFRSPVLVTPGNDAQLMWATPTSPPLGAVQHVTRATTTIDLPAGGLLLLYTDGLVERRGEDIDAGLERLRSSVKAGSAYEVCRDVMHDLIGNEAVADDIALLAVQRAG